MRGRREKGKPRRELRDLKRGAIKEGVGEIWGGGFHPLGVGVGEQKEGARARDPRREEGDEPDPWGRCGSGCEGAGRRRAEGAAEWAGSQPRREGGAGRPVGPGPRRGEGARELGGPVGRAGRSAWLSFLFFFSFSFLILNSFEMG